MIRKASAGRRRRKSIGARLRPFRVTIALLGVLAVAAAGFAISWRGFAPREIIVSGDRVVSRADVLAAAEVAPDVSMWLQNPASIARRIARIPYVEQAWVHRIPPSTLAIRVRERVPFAVVRSGTRSAIVDRHLRVLQSVEGIKPALGRLPILELPNGIPLEPGAFLHEGAARALRDDERLMLAAHVAPVALRLDRFGELDATIRGGVRILLGGESDLAKKLGLVGPILAQVVRGSRRVAAIDLRAPDTPVVIYSDGSPNPIDPQRP